MGLSRGRIKTVSLAVLFALFTSAMVIAGYRYANPAIRANLIAFTTDSNTQTTIRFQVGRNDPKLPVTCRIIAQDFSTAIVGDKYVDIPAGSAKNIEITEVIPTRNRAVTASVVRCLPKDR